MPPTDASVMIEGPPAARLASKAVCAGLGDLIASGAAMVLIGGLPAARTGDSTLHKGIIVGPCAANVLIGGPAFSLPSVVTIQGSEEYQSKVLRDLYFLSTTRSGRELLARWEKAGQPILITVPTTTPPNNGNRPTDIDSYSDGKPCGSTIFYNPDQQNVSRGPNGEIIRISPQEALMHEGVHALAYSEGNNPTGFYDPQMKGTKRSESQAMGTGSYQDTFPTENSFRKDMNLEPPRATHARVDAANEDPALIPPEQNFRPGGP